ncbi:MAG TPA: sugar-binding transcriptional regulator [Zeimonas sp.]|nr:sugar-binding transcriptional regulator [Zeimonas sp.]
MPASRAVRADAPAPGDPAPPDAAHAQAQDAAAVRVARLYYYEHLTTASIADELGTSRSTVSRLLSRAHERGLVEIRIHDPARHPQGIEAQLRDRYGLRVARVVSVPETADEHDWLERVAAFAAGYLNTVIDADTVVGIAWGTTLRKVAAKLSPKQVANVDVVALNGSGTAQDIDSTFSSDIVTRFARNYGARPHAFPVPAFFDHSATRTALWRERSVRRLLDLQKRARVLVFSVGAFSGQVPSHVHTGGFLEPADLRSLRRDRVAGDIATVFFRADGSHADIALNARASGPDLALLRRAKHSICIASGTGKAAGVRAALAGGFVNTLIVDEPTARLLLRDAPSPRARSARTP